MAQHIFCISNHFWRHSYKLKNGTPSLMVHLVTVLFPTSRLSLMIFQSIYYVRLLLSSLHYLIFINGDIICYKLVGIYKTRKLMVRYIIYCSTVTWMLLIVHWDYDESKAAINYWHIFETVESKSNFVRIWIQHDENWVYFCLIFFIIPDLYTSGWSWL